MKHLLVTAAVIIASQLGLANLASAADAEAKKPPAEPSEDAPAPASRRGEPSPIALKSKAFERETYFSMIARSEVLATRRDIQLLREIIARTS